MDTPNEKTMLVAVVLGGALFFLLFGQRSLADVFYFLAGVVGITAFLKVRQIRRELEKTKNKISERVEEIEYRIDTLEKKREKAS